MKSIQGSAGEWPKQSLKKFIPFPSILKCYVSHTCRRLQRLPTIIYMSEKIFVKIELKQPHHYLQKQNESKKLHECCRAVRRRKRRFKRLRNYAQMHKKLNNHNNLYTKNKEYTLNKC